MPPRNVVALTLFYLSFGLPANSIAADVAPRAAYEGQRIVNIRFDPPAQPVTSEDLNGLLKWKPGDVLTQNDVRSTIKRLYATGSYSSIDVDAEPVAGGVELVIRTSEQWFIGPVEARGKVNLPPSEGQLADAARLELGEPFNDEDLDRAMKGMRGLLERNGLYNAEVTPKIERDTAHQEVSITFQVDAGKRARLILPEVSGDTRLPVETIASAAKYKTWFRWKPATDANTQQGVRNILNRYAKKDRLTASVKLQNREYLAAQNRVRTFSPDIYSSGSITLNAAIAGTAASPDVTGQLQLQKASFNMLELPNGLSNATGTVAFTGTEAYIQNIKGESGGGQVTLSGTVGYGGPQTQFRVQATASGVHIQYPDTITTEVDANLAVNGTAASSLVAGRVSIIDVSLHSGADIGNMLTQAASPPSTSTGTVGPLAGMRFDVRIVTAPDAQFRTTLTQNLQADAHLTLVGTPDNPGMLGRVTVTEGDVVFFGSKYTIDQGTITFSNASKINPVLNIDLETSVQGVDVALTVSGPIDKMKLSYRSDPPLQFQQIVSLLASGTTPTTDPVLAAHAPAAPQQSLEQSGASTLLGQAVANPVSGRLQRLFGVSKLSIDPQIVGTTNTAQATLTLQQQITRDITFTYIEDVTSSNPQVIRAEWAISPRYSAIAQRDVNGEVTVDLFYKRRFH